MGILISLLVGQLAVSLFLWSRLAIHAVEVPGTSFRSS